MCSLRVATCLSFASIAAGYSLGVRAAATTTIKRRSAAVVAQATAAPPAGAVAMKGSATHL